jgi:hypothetical protein
VQAVAHAGKALSAVDAGKGAVVAVRAIELQLRRSRGTTTSHVPREIQGGRSDQSRRALSDAELSRNQIARLH